MNELKCTRYTDQDYDEENPEKCHCPVCGGFLTWKDRVPICNKCGTELLAIADRDEWGEEEYEGKICPISERKKDV